MIGIDGQGGSGKSTLAREVAGSLGRSTEIVEGDDFYSDLPDQEKAALTPEEGVDKYFDWPRLRREVLMPVANGAEVLRYQRYDWDNQKMGEWVEVPMPDVVIVEGIYTLRPELCDLVDVKVYVDADEATRTRRQEERGENSNEWIRRWIAAEDFYVAQRGPQKVANLLVHGGPQ